MTAPAVSVVIAAYRGAALVEETLASLAAQSFADFEIIAVDDCSPDDTLAVLRRWPDPRLRVIALAENGGPVRARNRGFAEARGRYVAALDQDDLCHPDRLARQVAYLDAHPHVLLVGSDAAVLQGGAVRRSTYLAATTPALTRWQLTIENPLAWSSVMFRLNAARALDPITRPELLYAEDFDFYHRLSALGEIARIDAPLITYRKHDEGASLKFETTMWANAARVLAGAYATVLGDDAPETARRVVEHMMAGTPVPGREALVALGGALARLQAAHLAAHAPAASDVRLIRWHTARRWAGVARAGLRAGTITLPDALAARPPHLGLGHAGLEELAWSRLVGRARRVARRRHTLAA